MFLKPCKDPWNANEGIKKKKKENCKPLFTLPLELMFGSGFTIALDSKLSVVSSQMLERNCHYI
jgi:hypothetical protein